MENIKDIWNIDKDLFFQKKILRDKIEFVLGYAILAPSTHNSQPWLLDIGENFCKIYINSSLYLEKADKDCRDLFISLGCFVENLIIASQYFNIYKSIGYSTNVNEIISRAINKNYLIAEILFDDFVNNGDEGFAELFSAITKRFNARGPFLNKKLELELINSFYGLNDIDGIKLNLMENKNDIEQIARLTSNGMKLAHNDKDFRKELSRWTNNLFSLRKAGMTWRSMRAPFLVSFCLSYLIRFFNLGLILSKLNYKSIASAPLVCVITSEDGIMNWINIGRISERVMLNAYLNGLNTSIYVAAIESRGLRLELNNIIKAESPPQFLICIGYMNLKSMHTPRYSIESKLINNI